MFFKKEKKMNVPDLWNFMTSLNKKDKALFKVAPVSRTINKKGLKIK